jgi:hypothetical protein
VFLFVASALRVPLQLSILIPANPKHGLDTKAESCSINSTRGAVFIRPAPFSSEEKAWPLTDSKVNVCKLNCLFKHFTCAGKINDKVGFIDDHHQLFLWEMSFV